MTSLKQMDRAELQMFYEAALKEYCLLYTSDAADD